MMFPWFGVLFAVAALLLVVHLIRRVRVRREAVLWFVLIVVVFTVIAYGLHIRVGG